ncbi:MAG: acetyl-CoA carboxylase biotin carboxyl carrier protein [Thermomicrobiales bacterium]
MSGQHRPATPEPAEVEHLIHALIGMMRDGGMTELDLAFGDVTVRLRGAGVGMVATAPAAMASASGYEPPAVTSDLAIVAPMIGTFYASPSPGAAAYVEIGDTIAPGQIIGIIEAMKIMNEIPADRGGVVTELIAANGQPVEYGTPLIRIRPGDGRAS